MSYLSLRGPRGIPSWRNRLKLMLRGNGIGRKSVGLCNKPWNKQFNEVLPANYSLLNRRTALLVVRSTIHLDPTRGEEQLMYNRWMDQGRGLWVEEWRSVLAESEWCLKFRWKEQHNRIYMQKCFLTSIAGNVQSMANLTSSGPP